MHQYHCIFSNFIPIMPAQSNGSFELLTILAKNIFFIGKYFEIIQIRNLLLACIYDNTNVDIHADTMILFFRNVCEVGKITI